MQLARPEMATRISRLRDSSISTTSKTINVSAGHETGDVALRILPTQC